MPFYNFSCMRPAGFVVSVTNSIKTLLNWNSLVNQCKSLISLEGVQKIDQAVVERKLRLEKISNLKY